MTTHSVETTHTIALNAVEKTRDGFLRAPIALLQAAVADYYPAELGMNGLDPERQYGVLYSEASVFDAETANNAKMRPLTLKHPKGFFGAKNVTPMNYRDSVIGGLGENFQRDDDRLVGNVAIYDWDGLDAIYEGIDQISLGAGIRVEPSSGEYNGKAYDFVTVGPILVNHAALVVKGKFGPDVALLLNEEGQEVPMTDEELVARIDSAADAAANKTVAQMLANNASPPAGAVADAPPSPPADPPPAETAAAAPGGDDKTVGRLEKALGQLEGFINRFKPNGDDAAGAPAAADAPAGAAADPPVAETPAAEPPQAVSEERIAELVNAKTARRMQVMETVLPLLPAGGDYTNVSNAELLVKAAGDTIPDAANRSEDYLLGQLQAQAANRQAAQAQRGQMAADVANNQVSRSVVNSRTPPPVGTNPAEVKARREWYLANAHQLGEKENAEFKQGR